jgi:hypothetical protein
MVKQLSYSPVIALKQSPAAERALNYYAIIEQYKIGSFWLYFHKTIRTTAHWPLGLGRAQSFAAV